MSEKQFGRCDRSAFDSESEPATKADIEELKRLILSLRPAAPNVSLSYSTRFMDAARQLRTLR